MAKVKMIQNVVAGKLSCITTNNIEKDSRLNKIFNNRTMSALDNYAQHENLNINISSLENDMFDDVAISVSKDRETKLRFPMSVPQTKEEVPEFFRNLYNNIHNGIYGSVQTVHTAKLKRSIWNDFKMYIKNVADRYDNMRYSLISKF